MEVNTEDVCLRPENLKMYRQMSGESGWWLMSRRGGPLFLSLGDRRVHFALMAHSRFYLFFLACFCFSIWILGFSQSEGVKYQKLKLKVPNFLIANRPDSTDRHRFPLKVLDLEHTCVRQSVDIQMHATCILPYILQPHGPAENLIFSLFLYRWFLGGAISFYTAPDERAKHGKTW